MAGPSQFVDSFNASLDNFGVVSNVDSRLTWTISGGPLNTAYGWKLEQGSLSVEGSSSIDGRGMDYFTARRPFPAGAVTLTVTFFNNSTMTGSANVSTASQYDPILSVQPYMSSPPSAYQLVIANGVPYAAYTWTLGSESGAGTLDAAGADSQATETTYNLGETQTGYVTFDDGTTKGTGTTINEYNPVIDVGNSSWAPSPLYINFSGGIPSGMVEYSINNGPSNTVILDASGNYSAVTTDVYQVGFNRFTAVFAAGPTITKSFIIPPNIVATGAPVSASMPSQVGLSLVAGYPDTTYSWKVSDRVPGGYTESGIGTFDSSGNSSVTTVGSWFGVVTVEIIPNANPGQSLSIEVNVTSVSMNPGQVSAYLPCQISYSIAGATPDSTYTWSIDSETGSGIIDGSGNASGSTSGQFEAGSYQVQVFFNDNQGQYFQTISLS